MLESTLLGTQRPLNYTYGALIHWIPDPTRPPGAQPKLSITKSKYHTNPRLFGSANSANDSSTSSKSFNTVLASFTFSNKFFKASLRSFPRSFLRVSNRSLISQISKSIFPCALVVSCWINLSFAAVVDFPAASPLNPPSQK